MLMNFRSLVMRKQSIMFIIRVITLITELVIDAIVRQIYKCIVNCLFCFSLAYGNCDKIIRNKDGIVSDLDCFIRADASAVMYCYRNGNDE